MTRLAMALLLACFLAWSWCVDSAGTAPQRGPPAGQGLARPTLTPTTTGKPRPTATLSPEPSSTSTRTPTPIPSGTPTRTPTPLRTLTPTRRPTLPEARWQQYLPVVRKTF
jgi:hypothetical protein